MPVILVFCIVGAYASNNSAYGILVMLVFGVIGFFMEENDIPIAPCILGIVIGPILERNFVTTMIKADGAFLAFVERPIAAGLAAAVVVIWLSLLSGSLRRRRASTAR
jgi:TctA family transporter